MKKLLLLLAPLLLAQAPAFLQHTLLPAQFTAAFTTYQKGEINPPARVLDNKVFYLETPDGTRYFKSFFAQSALLPGAPPRFKNTSVWWFVERDPAHGNQYTARVFSVQLKEWALMAVNLGPPRRNLVERYYQHFTVPPATMICDTPDRRPPPGPALWFYTSGHNSPSGPPPLPQADQGYFGMLTTPVTGPDHQLYNPPYSIIGGGSGVLHQAYGQLVYQQFNLTPRLTPESFTPPHDYKRVVTPEVCPVEAKLLLYNCSVCHYTEAGPTELYEPQKPGAKCP